MTVMRGTKFIRPIFVTVVIAQDLNANKKASAIPITPSPRHPEDLNLPMG